MPLSWNEIKDRALAFSKDWASAKDEKSEAQRFWIAFFDIFGFTKQRVFAFEHAIIKQGDAYKGNHGWIDLLWPGVLLVEHKSLGKNLNKAYDQAIDYFAGLKERDLPRYVIVCDFAQFRLYDLIDNTEMQFPLADLHQHIKRFGFIAGYQTQTIKAQDPVNVKAAEQMGKLHDKLKASGYEGHPLEVLLVRLLFCLFADDTGIFQPSQSFREWIEQRTASDGSDLGPQLAQLFQVLNTPELKRQKTLDEQLARFPYVNGKLFEEPLPLASLNSAMREALLDCCGLNWSAISPAIFGALFQSIMDEKARRNLGAHYTSEENILKLIKPLFLDALWEEFNKIKGNHNKLFDFHKKLRTLNFFDPACGCGNFLVITYRELRMLELGVLRASMALERDSGQKLVDVQQLISIDVDQFYGIEIEEFPAQIAQVALWLIDHQMNTLVSVEFGAYYARIPLKTTPHIVNGNALTINWADVLVPERCSYVLGNPPFVGKQFQTVEQKADMALVMRGMTGTGVLDFVTAWYVKATHYMTGNNAIRAAFVSTNSIVQGEQVGILWGWLLAKGVHIHFAHRTFQWSNEARGVAAVHCVIVGFALYDTKAKTIYEYDDIRGDSQAVNAANINPYLVDALDVVLPRRDKPVCAVPELLYGSKPVDNGAYLFTAIERREFLKKEPAAKHLFRRFMGATEFLYNEERWCLWLKDANPSDLKLPAVRERIDQVKTFRAASKKPATRDMAAFATLFAEDRQRAKRYLVIPEVSSERRNYIPIGMFTDAIVQSNLNYMLPGGKLFELGVLSSAMHVAWVRYTCGRLESRYRYSAGIVYNNYPWPDSLTPKQKLAIEAAAQNVLDARAEFGDFSLADLYDPLSMPPALSKAHQKLDAAVDAAYGKKNFKSDAERVAFLFTLYQKYTSLLPAEKVVKRRKSNKAFS